MLNLFADEMIGVSDTMLDPAGKAHVIILKYEDDLKAPWKRLSTAHASLVAAAQPLAPERVKLIIAAQGKIDFRHDAIIRGVWALFDALVELLPDEAAALIALRDWLIPDGLSSQNKSYGGEAGQAKLLGERLTAEIRQKTDAIVVGHGGNTRSLTSYLEEWISLGQQLGAYENERGTLENTPGEAGPLHNARLAWVRAVNALISNAEAASVTEEDWALLFGPLQSAERKADDRAREAKAKAAAEAKKATEEKTPAEAKKLAEEKPAADATKPVEEKPGDEKKPPTG